MKTLLSVFIAFSFSLATLAAPTELEITGVRVKENLKFYPMSIPQIVFEGGVQVTNSDDDYANYFENPNFSCRVIYPKDSTARIELLANKVIYPKVGNVSQTSWIKKNSEGIPYLDQVLSFDFSAAVSIEKVGAENLEIQKIKLSMVCNKHERLAEGEDPHNKKFPLTEANTSVLDPNKIQISVK